VVFYMYIITLDTVYNTLTICSKISDSHSGRYEGGCLLDCCAV
jgi:hypothetical protein